jgi:HEAT repeat protein
MTGAGQVRPQQPQKVTLEGLLFDLKSPDGWRRRDAVQLLGDKKIVSAVPEMVQLWNDSDLEVRRTLVRALDNIGDIRGAEPLGRMMSDIDKDVRRNAIKTVTNIYLRSGSGAGSSGRRFGGLIFNPDENPEDRLVEPDVAVSATVIQALAQRLQDDDNNIREDAAKSLGTLQGHAAVPQMVRSIKQEQDKGVLLALIRSLGRIGDSGVAGDIIPLAYHQDKSVHDAAIETLGFLRNPIAVPDLTKLYETDIEERHRLFGFIPIPRGSSDDLQIKSFEALAGIGSAKSKKDFAAAIVHADPKYRQAAAEGLARVAEADHVTAVSRQRMVENKDGPRMAQSFALYRMGRKEYLEDLIRGLEDGNEQVFGYLLEFEGKEVSLLYPFLESSNARVRSKVAEALGWVGAADALKRLDPLAADPNSEVVSSSVLAMRRIDARLARQPKSAKAVK